MISLNKTLFPVPADPVKKMLCLFYPHKGRVHEKKSDELKATGVENHLPL